MTIPVDSKDEVEPEATLIRRAIEGDHRAFAALVEPLRAPVWRFLCRFLADQALAEDVTQETFLRVYTRLRSFGGRAKFSTWVFQIARNAAVDADRARRRRHSLVERVAPVSSGWVAGGEWKIELNEALSSLPVRLRETFVLVEVVGLDYRETGAVLGIPAGTVKSRMFHARRQLVDWMNADEM